MRKKLIAMTASIDYGKKTTGKDQRKIQRKNGKLESFILVSILGGLLLLAEFQNPTRSYVVASLAFIVQGIIIGVITWIGLRLGSRILMKKPSVASFLTAPIKCSENMKRAAVSIFICGTLLYFFMVSLDWFFNFWGNSYLHSIHVYFVSHYFSFQALPSTGNSVGFVGFLAALVATICLAIYNLQKGVLGALSYALKTFLLPVIMIMIGGLIVFGQSNQMINHVTYFASWTLGSKFAYLVSNFFVLVYSAFLEIILILFGREPNKGTDPDLLF
jgi:hypothetical protein